MTTVLAVRHGETTWNRQRRVQGWAPAPLTDRGREQAGRLGARLGAAYDIDHILSSDLHRTEETVDVLRDHVDAPVTFEPAWRERDVGVHQGFPVDEMAERFPEYDLEEAGREAARRRPESGECLVDVRERVVERWETTLAESDPEETVLVVTRAPERPRHRRDGRRAVTGELCDHRVRSRRRDGSGGDRSRERHRSHLSAITIHQRTPTTAVATVRKEL
jgi:probable phosphoglycerate mutase